MKTIRVNDTIKKEERETIVHYDGVTKKWLMDSTIPKHFKKALKQGWTPVVQYAYEDGTVCGMELTAPERAITIRSVTKKEMSQKQNNNLPRNEA